MFKKINIFQPIGVIVISLLASIGRLTLFSWLVIKNIFTPPFYFHECRRALFEIGFLSLPVVGLTAFFTGGALALQLFEGGASYGASEISPSIHALGMVRELGPVLASLMVAGRVSSSVAAEIATMRVTEQIDALSTLSTHPIKYLIVPRVLAGVISMPILVGIADILGILGGYLVGTTKLGFSGVSYIQNTLQHLEPWDVYSGLIKAVVFGFIIVLMGCYHGYNSNRGAEGVGRATIQAVVTASILILAFNYILTGLFFDA